MAGLLVVGGRRQAAGGRRQAAASRWSKRALVLVLLKHYEQRHLPSTPSTNKLSVMAPNLAEATHQLVQGMMESHRFNTEQIAAAVGCSTRSIRTIRANLRCFGTTRAPRNTVRRPRTITPPMLDALCDRLNTKPEMCQDEMVAFIAAEFDVEVEKEREQSPRVYRMVQENYPTRGRRTKCRPPRLL